MRALSLCAATWTLMLLTAVSALAQQRPTTPRALPTGFKEWRGDLDGMIERRQIRVLVPYSRTLYFNDNGRERGVTVDIFRAFERYVNQKFQRQLGKRPITVYIRPTTRDKLLPNVAGGLGDIAAGNLTVTDERRETVEFYVAPDQVGMSELVLTGPKSPAIKTADDLAGKRVHVRKSSSYHESLVALNDRFKREGKPLVTLVLVPDELEDEDMMEMLDLGVLDAIVVDDWKAKMWAQVLPKVTINAGAVVRSGGNTGWAIRKDSPKLKELLAEFFTKVVVKQSPRNDRSWGYSKRIKRLTDPTTQKERERFEGTLALFRKYGEQYGFDPLMLAAQGYQESQLNQDAKSPVGAIGIMQVMPATGQELGVGDIKVTEANVHAGAKYMDQLMTKYLGDATFDETNRTLFAFACYNAGPGNIARLRKEAAKRGFDPQKWFNNVEVITAQKIGIETTTYVRNIYKYYIAYKLMLDVEEMKKKALDGVKQTQ
jgi:membrane-bound lytic murein transglycosylase MltF